METKVLWSVIAISVIVGIVTAIATVSLTGDVVKVGNKLVYTKAEVDSKFATIELIEDRVMEDIENLEQEKTTNRSILAMFGNSCEVRRHYSDKSCNEVCDDTTSLGQCVLGEAVYGSMDDTRTTLLSCNEIPDEMSTLNQDWMTLSIDTSCLCCSVV